MFGLVHNGNKNRPVSLQVCQVHALAASLGARAGDVPCAADIWEVGEISEMRVLRGEVRASSALGADVPDAVLGRPRDTEEERRGRFGRGVGDGGLVEGMLALLGVGIHDGVVGRDNIITCGCSTSNVREEESEDECSEVDHRENAGV